MHLPLLVLETATAHSTQPASVALRDAQGNVHPVILEPHAQASQLVPVLQSLLHEHGLHFHDLSTLLFTVGPGSFTGIRIGLAVARTILFSCPNVTAFPLSTLQAIAACRRETECIATLRAGKGEIYAQHFRREGEYQCAQDAIRLLHPEALESGLPVIDTIPDAGTLAAHVQHIPPQAVLPAEPVYIRPPDAKLPSRPLL
jgi:tRNA threonylcarbamoyl adenosine modification protein YeaZ